LRLESVMTRTKKSALKSTGRKGPPKSTSNGLEKVRSNNFFKKSKVSKPFPIDNDSEESGEIREMKEEKVFKFTKLCILVREKDHQENQLKKLKSENENGFILPSNVILNILKLVEKK